MPTYEYACESCDHRFERFHGMNDEANITCPRCGGAAKRLISGGAGIIVKGGTGRSSACGSDVPCCGRGEPCGKSHGCS
ncbi:MAG TPA: zinc ribbon domain-containing protein [Spirochaetota bacterium]|nr:zinc ribbon domain-containing protein [Spirochaetota bacterium]